MGQYTYKRPQGTLHRVSIRKWNKVYAHRGRWPFVVAEVYLQDDKATVQYVATLAGKAFVLLLSPLLYVVGTCQQGIVETHDDIRGMLFDKKYGRFISDMVYRDRFNFQWERLMYLTGGIR